MENENWLYDFLRDKFDENSEIENDENLPDEVILVQKWVQNQVLNILTKITNNEISFWRKWFIDLIWKNGKKIRLFQVKWVEDVLEAINLFSPVENIFFITWSDVIKKERIAHLKDDLKILWWDSAEKIWWCRTQLLLFWSKESLERLANWEVTDIVYTRWAPLITKKALEQAYWEEKAKDIEIKVVTWNTEAFVSNYQGINTQEIVVWTEIVQTWTSLRENNQLVLLDDWIYNPERLDDWNLKLETSIELPNNVADLVKTVTTEVDVVIAKLKK